METSYFAPFWENLFVDSDNDGKNDLDYMHCECSDLFDGPLCEIKRVPCGTDKYCYYGSECVERIGTDDSKYECDCSLAITDTMSYAGKLCQYQATSFCLNNEISNFCVNSGVCVVGGSGGCDCPDEFDGDYCEIVSTTAANSGTELEIDDDPPQEEIIDDDPSQEEIIDDSPHDETDDEQGCDLPCVHGECRISTKSVSPKLGQIIQNMQLMFFDSFEQEYKQCVCHNEMEWTGPLCDVAVEKCDGPLCDCANINSSIASFFAGKHCKHPVFEVCTTNFGPNQGELVSYCVNGGICTSRVSPGQPHAGCYCEQGFLGPHCEMYEAKHIRHSDIPASWSRDDTDEKSPAAITFIVIGSLLLTGISVFLLLKHIKRRNTSKNLLNDWDHTDSVIEPNISPRRCSVITIPSSDKSNDSISNYDSNQDPIVMLLKSTTNNNGKRSPTIVSDDEDDDDNHSTISLHNRKNLSLKTDSKRIIGDKRALHVCVLPPKDDLHNVEIV